MFPAKGIAMKKGIKEAISFNANIVLFLDADIKNLTTEWVDKLVEGCINCDMVRGYYQRHSRDAPVTKLIARPMPGGGSTLPALKLDAAALDASDTAIV